MTRNQIEYAKLNETVRANRAQEQLTADRDAAVRRLGLDTLAETSRHNQQVELQARDNLAEQYRNNVAQLAELQRSHMSNEGIAVSNYERANRELSEAIRSHQASEQIAIDRLALDRAGLAENQRHNLANEDISLFGTQSSRYAAELSSSSHVSAASIAAAASQYASDNTLIARQLQNDVQKYGIDVNAQAQRSSVAEQYRSNLAREAETRRANLARESLLRGQQLETARHNVATEAFSERSRMSDVNLRQQQLSIQQQQATTQQRRADVDISLAPSQKFSNYVSGIRGLADTASTVWSTITGRKRR